MNAFPNLPKELLLIIITLLDAGSEFSLSQTCRLHLRCIVVKKVKKIKKIKKVKNVVTDIIMNDYINLFKWFTNHQLHSIDELSLISLICTTAAEYGSFKIFETYI